MTANDKSRPVSEQAQSEEIGRKAEGEANDSAERNQEGPKHGTPPEPGTEGPAGPVDDQPQREDEYLSSVLREFNPQRKDKKLPPAEAETRDTDPDRSSDPSQDGNRR